MDPSPPPLDRTPSAHSRYTTAAAWCFERPFEGQDQRPPVRVIIFDCDETLTLSTFLPDDVDLRTKLDSEKAAVPALKQWHVHGLGRWTRRRLRWTGHPPHTAGTPLLQPGASKDPSKAKTRDRR
mmetsp:Transcript_40419/g.93817  ORF Transcript_40419/g.93817 Transcript_40419/m.93817 type:complete len:125 (-) Transcript_40419:84-458(-)